MFRPFDVVRVRTIPPNRGTHDSWGVNRRTPLVGDVGTIVEVLRAEGVVDQYVVECVEPGGLTAWLSEFRAEDLETAPVQSKTSLPLEHLTLHPMASGQSALLLTSQISWEGFPAYAETVVALIGGRLGTRADGGGERVWCVGHNRHRACHKQQRRTSCPAFASRREAGRLQNVFASQ